MRWPSWKKPSPAQGDARKAIGAQGEALAAKYLKRRGYRILDRNVVLGRYEIDLIAREKDTIVFVEVRSRTEGDAIAPEDTIGPTKQHHIRQAARIYIAQHPSEKDYYRFDVVTVLLHAQGNAEITLFQDAFQA